MATNDTKVKLLRLANVHYLHPNLNKAHQFLLDFGMTVVEKTDTKIYYRGYGIDPYIYVAEQHPDRGRAFGGGAFVVDSHSELEKAVKIPGAGPIQKAEGPGGGHMVVLKDPNGISVKLLHGQQELEPSHHLSKEPRNTPQEKERLGEFIRVVDGPAKVHKLGHYGYMVPPPRFLPTRSWYLNNFNFAITDTVFNPETDVDEVSFMHIDLGDTYTDHHGVFVGVDNETPDFPAQVHHSSFEVHDIDAQGLGHQWLEEHGWTNCWGIGRHILGSQIFDYWFDASEFIIEHYTDGDVVNSKSPPSREKASKHSLYAWGPNVPKEIVRARTAADWDKIPVVARGLVSAKV